jgi:hypothetical protein
MPKSKTHTRTFTMPDADFALIGDVKRRCRKLDLELNGSEVVRVGIAALLRLPEKDFIKAVNALVKLKRGKQEQEPEGQS